ncbi:MAG TPA: hypothetical protein VFY97_10795 [Rhodanobacteraceae bacterium]|nr:hypothetical protein [Rhodanobacteraceae bacterium]
MTTEPSRPTPTVFRWRLFPAVAIVAIGAMFLARNLGYPLTFLDHGNWWAIIILLAALAPLMHAYEVYRARGRIDAEAAHSLLAAAAVALVGVLFLFELDWGTWWPLFVILGGLFTLVPRRHCRHDRYRHGDDEADGAPLRN